MRRFRTLIALVTLAAFAGRPALAALHTCCCVHQVEVTQSAAPSVERPCCAAKHAAHEQAAHEDAAACEPNAAGVSARSCCAEKKPAAVVATAGCCCLEEAPAVPASRDAARTTAEQGPLLPVVATVDLFNAVPPAPGAVLSAEARPLCGPPLLALYCIWRK
jgi:hypothetical protein